METTTMDAPWSAKSDDEDGLLSPQQSAEFLSESWGRQVTVTAFRMLRLRRRNDPDMPQPDFVAGDIYLWKKSTLRRIKPPKLYNKG